MQKRLLSLIISLLFPCFSIAGEFNIGVYYYPGWKENVPGTVTATPWEAIKPYPQLEPKLGWYDDGSKVTVRRQLYWMARYGINYVVFDWYYGRDKKIYLEQPLKAYLYLSDEQKYGVKFSLIWSNHTDYIFNMDQLRTMIRIWCKRYMVRKDFMTIDDKPVVFIFSIPRLNKNLAELGMTSQQFFAYADKIAKQYGLAGISFVGATGAADKTVDYTASSGYAGFSAYNFHAPATFLYDKSGGFRVSHSYSELDLAYRDHWYWMTRNSDGFYIVPLTAGWDKRPWGGSSDPLHDNSSSTPEEFESHLVAAKALMLAAPEKTRKTAIICCWNEYGEGSYIEPTVSAGFSSLAKIKKVFASE